MNRVILNIGIISNISNLLDLFTRFHDSMIMHIEIIRYISISKYKVIVIDLIMRFHELRDYE